MTGSMRPSRVAIAVLALLSACATARRERAPALPAGPNIVFILADDLGAMDVHAFNPDTFYETPNIDRLAREGLAFTQAYAASPVCSPTRYSIMTGRYPTRARATNYFSGRRAGRFEPAPLEDRMAPDEHTIAEALRGAGYRTAHVGKWHLGSGEDLGPEAQGFEVNVGGVAGGAPYSYFSPYRNLKLPDGPPGEHLTTRLADEAIALVERFARERFFLFLSFPDPHVPLEAPPALVEKYRSKALLFAASDPPTAEFGLEEQVWPTGEPRHVRTRQDHPVYAAMIEALDREIGRVLERLDALGLARDTIVVFTSDNGGLSTAEGWPTSNLPLRGGKGWVYEGGLRVPLVVRWPGVVAPGSASACPISSIDFLPTLLDAAGVRHERASDGLSFLPLLGGGTAPERDALFWHYPHYSNQGGFPGGAVRAGDLKLVENYENGRFALFDLAADPGERRDLSREMPDLAARLKTRLHRWYREVGAHFLLAKEGGPPPWRP